MNAPIKTGLECLIENPPDYLLNKRIGLLCNPASVHGGYRHAVDLVRDCFPGQLTALFSPQHGFYAEKQDNMIESDHITDPKTQLPVFSLYGETRIPTPDMFEHIDVLLVDIQDVGTRVYTFIYTVSYCLETAAAMDKKVVILDRPNPVGGTRVEGNLLSSDMTSFVGRYEIPMRHGMTIAEIATFFNEEYKIGCDLSTIPMQGWQREMYWTDTGLEWIIPSPNLPTPASACVYPGQVIFEGTNLSEGRGTTQPFEVFGAPYLDCDTILKDIKQEGVHLRPVCFEPTSGKWKETACRGFQIHITDRKLYRPYALSLELLQSIIKHHPKEFAFKQPPYEYEFERMPIDLILGSKPLRQDIEKGRSIAELSESWNAELERYKLKSRSYHLYGKAIHQ